jgi:hypothetical protein
MKTLEEKTQNLERLLKASEKGDVAAVNALLESGNVDINGTFSFGSVPKPQWLS